MRRRPLLIVLALVLSGCRPPQPPVPPSLTVNDADFTDALTRPPTGGPLGLTPNLRGQLAAWSLPGVRPVSLEWPQKTLIGTIDAAGNYDLSLPARPAEAQRLTLGQLVRHFNILEKGDCSVDTLEISAPDAEAGELALYTTRDVVASASLGPQLSPPPPFASFTLFKQYFNASEMALYSSAAASARGELSCTSPNLQGSRYHLYVNMTFAAGWNTATLIYGEERAVAGEGVQKMLLRGGLVSSSATP